MDYHKYYSTAKIVKKLSKALRYHNKTNHGSKKKGEVDKTKETQCNQCQKSFPNSNRFHVHYNSVHREKTFKCEKCSGMFAFRSKLQKHIIACDGIVKTRNNSKTKKVNQRLMKTIY